MTDPRNNARATRGRPFQPGNPGRPKGARHKTTLLAEKLMSEDVEGVVKGVLAAARSGDMAAARIVLDRLVPVRKGRPVVLDLPTVENAEGVLRALGLVISETAAGNITPEEATILAGLLDAKRKAIETTDIERRLATLEARS